MPLRISTALATLLLLVPAPSYAASVTIFPDLKTAKEAYKAKDYSLAAKNWIPLAHKGIAEAQVELGKLYMKGLGVQQNHDTALNLFISASEKNDPRAMFEIGRIYEQGLGVRKDVQKAKEWYQLAGENGYPRGYYAIGEMIEKDKFNQTPQISPEAKENIRRALNKIKKGDFSQAASLATAYEQGAGIPRNNRKALTYFFVAENSGAENVTHKIKNIQTKVSLDDLIGAQRDANLLLADNNKILKEPRRELINNLKHIQNPKKSKVAIEEQKNKALPYYEAAAQENYKRGTQKTAEIKGFKTPIQQKNSTPPKKKYRIFTDLKTQFVGEENLDLKTRSNDAETSLILNGKIGAYLYPTANITTYTEIRGLHSTGVATSSDDDDDDTSDNLSFLEIRQAWIEFDHLFRFAPTSLKLGRQRFYDPRGLWWNRDLDAVKLSLNSTLTNGFVAIGENQDVYRLGDSNELERDEKDRLRILGELSHQYAPSHLIDVRFILENDHSGTERIGQDIPDNDRDREDNKLLWTGLRAKGKMTPHSAPITKIGYRADIIGLSGEEDTVATIGGPSADLRTVSSINNRDVMAWAFDGSLDFQLDTYLEPTITVGYAYGSGDDGRGDNNAFRQSDLDGNTSLFPEDRVSSSLRNYGEVLRPELSNIHIANLGASIPILKASDTSLNYFSYWIDDKKTALRSSGISAPLSGQDDYLGQALDFSANINIEKELRLTNPVFQNAAIRIKIGGFKAGDAYGGAEGEFAYRGSTELRIKF